MSVLTDLEKQLDIESINLNIVTEDFLSSVTSSSKLTTDVDYMGFNAKQDIQHWETKCDNNKTKSQDLINSYKGFKKDETKFDPVKTATHLGIDTSNATQLFLQIDSLRKNSGNEKVVDLCERLINKLKSCNITREECNRYINDLNSLVSFG